MADLLVVIATFTFFALCVLYVDWCERIMGAEELGGMPPEAGEGVANSAAYGGTAIEGSAAEATEATEVAA